MMESVEDIEEGEISDESQSVEEITEEDFKQQDAKTTTTSSKDDPSMVWMGDLLKYPVSSNYGSGLYNFAWAQAVQNKPLKEGLAREFAKSREEIELQQKQQQLLQQKQQQQKQSQTQVNAVSSAKKEVVCDVIIDSDSSEEIVSKKTVLDEGKEEGELEEGEIELDSEVTSKDENTTQQSESSLIDKEFEKKINSIKATLDTVTVIDAQKSFNGVCLRLWVALDSLLSIVKEHGASVVGALVDQAFIGIQAVNSVFNCMDINQREEQKDNISRLFAHVKGQVPSLFSPEQTNEIQASMTDSPSGSSSVIDMEIDEDMRATPVVKNDSGILGEKPPLVRLGILGEKPGVVPSSSAKGLLQSSVPAKPLDQNNSTIGYEILKQGGLTFSRGRGNFGPLLDLHSDHDVDSLPSPTREAPPSLFLRERKVIGDGNVKSEPKPKVECRSEDDKVKFEPAAVHRYETDAHKAVSSYQQKFGGSSFFTSNLPSPTPSEDSDGGDGDVNGEVSSSSTAGNARVIDPRLQTVRPIALNMDKTSGQGLVVANSTLSAAYPHIRALSKSRDPRLRLANSEMSPFDLNAHSLARDTLKTESVEGVGHSRKFKNDGETMMDGQALKRQKNGMTNWEAPGDVQMPQRGGWLENFSTARTPVIDKSQPLESMRIDPRKSENIGILSGQRQATISSTFSTNSTASEQLPAVGAITTTALPSVLKDIAVNPTLLMQLIMEQQRLAADAQKSTSTTTGITPAFTSNLATGAPALMNAAPLKSYDIEQKVLENSRHLPQTSSVNPLGEVGKARMKPRDPRRVLHSSTFQNSESVGSEQTKINGTSTLTFQASKNINFRQQSEHAQTTFMPSQSSPPPDIARQFTTNLKNLADILSSQSTDSISTVTQSDSSSQPIPSISVNAAKADMEVSMPYTKDQRSGNGSTPEGATETSRSQHTWGDVEHLFEGYDDKQKAAIQRERARRIEEQNKMFAAKKLCLVLDLDHTLLNSAKFNEVEPVHEEILRKKEEQDREKTQRHLFRFGHMGMWTKLRPGVWTFLEKASKLFELHLYTMGNKLYATEMAKVLDPSGALFSGRVISKGDDEDPFDGDEKVPKSKDLEGVLGMESGVLIVDDSIKVWPHNKLNLILVERYTYFPCSRRQFGLPGPSLLEIDHDERPEEGTLASSLAVIERIHQIFFSNQLLHEVDVRNILAEEQRKILGGCRILFSRIFPVGEAKPHQHPLWQTAEQFGAVCTTQIDNLVTHVVANSLGTDKVNWAMSTGRFVVHPGWVEASALLYRRANENDFAVKINLP
ncbi:protein-serine/threonine phosphatase [Ranunculus cassubicifolius]